MWIAPLYLLVSNAWGIGRRNRLPNHTWWTFSIKMIMFTLKNVQWNTTTPCWSKNRNTDLYTKTSKTNLWTVIAPLRSNRIKYRHSKSVCTADMIQRLISRWSLRARATNCVGMKEWPPIQLWIKVPSCPFHSPRVHPATIQRKSIMILQTLISKIEI